MFKERRKTMFFLMKTAAAAVFVFMTLGHAYADPVATLQIDGDVAKTCFWTNSQLASGSTGPIQSVHYNSSDGSHTAESVSLLSVIDAASPRINSHIKNHILQFVVLVRGFDSYTVAFSLAELLPKFGNHPVWLALDKDGKPLSADERPASLVVPDDIKAGRWYTESLRLLWLTNRR